MRSRSRWFLSLLILTFMVVGGWYVFSLVRTDLNEPAFDSLEEEIHSLADKYVEVGAMVGVIDLQQNRSIYSFGRRSFDSPEPPDADTVFEIGSITKTFTAILAADMFERGLIDNENEIVAHYLPADNVTMPSTDGAQITFTHLLRHTSGIPRKPFVDIPRKPFVEGSPFPLPEGFDIQDPYAAYTTEDIYEYLTSYCTLEFKPGTRWEYSNTGYGLLGHTLGLIDGTSYESILKRNIFDVLHMNNSSLFLTEQQLTNVASGHYRDGSNTVPFWTAQDIFQGCGFIKSSLNDMFKYLEANMGLVQSPLKEAMERTHRRTPELDTNSMGYTGWQWYIHELEDGQEIIYSGGNTNGQSSFIAFNPSSLTGAIILMNSQNAGQIEFGFELMMAIDNY